MLPCRSPCGSDHAGNNYFHRTFDIARMHNNGHCASFRPRIANDSLDTQFPAAEPALPFTSGCQQEAFEVSEVVVNSASDFACKLKAVLIVVVLVMVFITGDFAG